MTQPYPVPSAESGSDDYRAAAEDIEWVKNFILGIRQIRGEMDIKPRMALPVLLQNASAADRERADAHAKLLQRVGKVESIDVLGKKDEPPAAATALLGDMRLLVPMKGVIDIDAERSRLEKQRDKIQAELGKSEGKLGNENFVNNAPEAVVTQEKERAEEFRKTLAQLAEQLQKLDALD